MHDLSRPGGVLEVSSGPWFTIGSLSWAWDFPVSIEVLHDLRPCCGPSQDPVGQDCGRTLDRT